MSYPVGAGLLRRRFNDRRVGFVTRLGDASHDVDPEEQAHGVHLVAQSALKPTPFWRKGIGSATATQRPFESVRSSGSYQ